MTFASWTRLVFAAALAASPKFAAGDFTMGCSKDTKDNRIMDGPQINNTNLGMTSYLCRNFCTTEDSAPWFYGLQNGNECWCFRKNKKRLSRDEELELLNEVTEYSGDCNMECLIEDHGYILRNQADNCGGHWAMNLMSREY